MKIAIVHDFLYQYGGGERFLETLLEIYQDAEIYTLGFNAKSFPESWGKLKIKVLLPNYPLIKKYPQLYAAVIIKTIQNLNLDGFDLVISSDSIFAKMLILPPDVIHICYQFTPANMLYGFLNHKEHNFFHFILSGFQKAIIRTEEYISARRVDRYLTLSKHTKARIIKYYGITPEVLYYGIKIPEDRERDALVSEEEGEYYLVVSRLTKEKKVDLAIAACNELNRKLIVCGTGPELNILKTRSGNNIHFKDFVSDEERDKYYVNCKALLFLNEEDFGLTPLECNAWGKPVIAYGKGGVVETIEEGISGVFFYDQTVAGLIKVIQEFEKKTFDKSKCKLQASKFNVENFRKNFQAIVDEELKRVVV